MPGLRHPFDERVHPRFTFRKLRCPVCRPEFVVTHLGIGIIGNLRLALEEPFGNRIEGIVRHAGCPYDYCPLQKVCQFQLGYHIVGRQCPVAIAQLGELLLELHGIHEIHASVGRQLHITLFHVQRTVVQHIQFTTETEVLLIGRHELKTDALVLVYINGIINIEVIE